METKRDAIITHADWDTRPTYFLRIDGDAVLRRSLMRSVHKGLNIADFRQLVLNVSHECQRKSFSLDFAHDSD